MNRKFYEELAHTVRLYKFRHKYLKNSTDIFIIPEVKDFLDDIISLLKQDNVNFDKNKFLRACGFDA